MFSEAFNFYKGYSIPHCKSIEQCREFIDHLPLVDTPEVFGLHPNADITLEIIVVDSSWFTVNL